MDNGFPACVNAIKLPLALLFDRLAQVELTAMDHSQDASWDRPYFDLIRNRNRICFPARAGVQHWVGWANV